MLTEEDLAARERTAADCEAAGALGTARMLRDDLAEIRRLQSEAVTPLAGPARPRRMTLFDLRKATGKGQIDVTARSGLSQSAISRMERASDHTVSNLRAYAKALGYADVEVVFVAKDGARVALAEPK